MKTYLTLLLAFFIASLSAQEIIVPLENQLSHNSTGNTPVYFKDVNNLLNKYVGTWIFNDGIHDLKIKITKNLHQDMSFGGKILNPNFEDDLSVTMIYKLNGVEIYNTTPVPPPSALINGNIIKSVNEVSLTYYEPTTSCWRYKRADLVLKFIPSASSGIGTPPLLPAGTLGWKRKSVLSSAHPDSKCFDGALVDATDFKIPANLILERE